MADMIKSMTGFASRTEEIEQASIAVTVRSVNHRFLDVQVRIPSLVVHVESRVRAIVQQRMARGRVEVNVTVQPRRLPVLEVDLNEPLVAAVNDAVNRMRVAGLVEGRLEVGDLLRIPQAMTFRERALEPDSPEAARLREGLEAALERALSELDAMRLHEGEHLRADLAARRDTTAGLLERIAAAAEEGRFDVEERLRERISQMPADLQADPAAVAQEIVKFAARSDITEEVVRFRAHRAQWKSLEQSSEPCGRKLDFLLQEMNREVNTIGAKADGLRVSELIVEMKAELEKLKEQVQNVE
jgi:uncharacterized protein (TIGR00255 family)